MKHLELLIPKLTLASERYNSLQKAPYGNDLKAGSGDERATLPAHDPSLHILNIVHL